jgi:hypothetical protein
MISLDSFFLAKSITKGMKKTFILNSRNDGFFTKISLLLIFFF